MFWKNFVEGTNRKISCLWNLYRSLKSIKLNKYWESIVNELLSSHWEFCTLVAHRFLSSCRVWSWCFGWRHGWSFRRIESFGVNRCRNLWVFRNSPFWNRYRLCGEGGLLCDGCFVWDAARLFGGNVERWSHYLLTKISGKNLHRGCCIFVKVLEDNTSFLLKIDFGSAAAISSPPKLQKPLDLNHTSMLWSKQAYSSMDYHFHNSNVQPTQAKGSHYWIQTKFYPLHVSFDQKIRFSSSYCRVFLCWGNSVVIGWMIYRLHSRQIFWSSWPYGEGYEYRQMTRLRCFDAFQVEFIWWNRSLLVSLAYLYIFPDGGFIFDGCLHAILKK